MNVEKFIQANNYNTQRTHNATPQEYFDKIVTLFHKHNVTNEQLNHSQWEVLQEIMDNKNFLAEKLKPLEPINYHLSLVGGSLRDLVVDNAQSINDYDIVISLGYVKESTLENLTNIAKTLGVHVDINNPEFEAMKRFREKSKIEQKNVKGYSWDNDDEKELNKTLNANYYLSKIVKHLMKDIPTIKNFESKNVREEYANYHIMSINQFMGANNKKVDLIVSDYEDMSFLSTFDIELCKLYLNLKNISNKEEIMDNIIQTGSMIRDLEDKTLSINVIKFSEENQEYFFNKHLLKLTEKYPDYKVNIFASIPMDSFTHQEKQRWVYGQHLKMNFNYPEKGQVVKKLKI